MIYLDNNATTRPAPETVEAVRDALVEHWHNPSSVHRPGQAARQRVELARRDVAELINASPREIVFASGGTEAIDTVIRGLLRAGRPAGRRVVVTTEVEHAAVRDLLGALAESGEAETRRLPVDGAGVADPTALDELLTPDVACVSVQWANNETGAIQPVEAIGAACRARRIPFHTDATQWVGKMPTDVRTVPVDALTFSAHKMHGPKGAGAVFIRRGVRMAPSIHGAQELGRRGGTENVPGVVGFGAAARVAMAWLEDESERTRLASLRDRLERGVLEHIPEARVNGPTAPGARLWNTTNIGFPRLEAEALLMLLSEQGLCASAGAACSSGSLDPSPVLLAMGVAPEYAHGSIRLSLSRETAEEEIERAIEIIGAGVRKLQTSSAAIA